MVNSHALKARRNIQTVKKSIQISAVLVCRCSISGLLNILALCRVVGIIDAGYWFFGRHIFYVELLAQVVCQIYAILGINVAFL